MRSLQLNDRAVDDLERYVTGLRPDHLLYVGPPEAFPLSRIIEITGGRRLVPQCELKEPIPVQGFLP